MVICAALKIHVYATNKDVILPCFRHSTGFQLIADLGFDAKKGYHVIEQGFLATGNRFLNRHDAFEHAVSCGQLSKTTIYWHEDEHSEQLYSEDLY